MTELQKAIDFLDEVNNSHSERGLTGEYVDSLITVVEAARLTTDLDSATKRVSEEMISRRIDRYIEDPEIWEWATRAIAEAALIGGER